MSGWFLKSWRVAWEKMAMWGTWDKRSGSCRKTMFLTKSKRIKDITRKSPFSCSVNFLKLIYFNWRIITTLWWFLPYIDMNQPRAHVCCLILNPPPTSLSTPSLWVVPEHQPWVHCFMHRTWTNIKDGVAERRSWGRMSLPPCRRLYKCLVPSLTLELLMLPNPLLSVDFNCFSTRTLLRVIASFGWAPWLLNVTLRSVQLVWDCRPRPPARVGGHMLFRLEVSLHGPLI